MNDDGEVIALAGLLQATRLVVDLAHQGECDGAALQSSLDSVLRIDASSPAAVFGGLEGLRLGLELLADVFGGSGRGVLPMRIAVSVLHLERKLSRDSKLLGQLRAGIEAVAGDLGRGTIDRDALAERLAVLYADTIGTLQPRIVVQGSGVHLSQALVVARIRAALLAAVRAAVLWRQLGGNRLRLFLRRRQVVQRARQLRPTID